MSEPKVSPDTLALRAPPPRVTRLNPRALIVVVATVTGLVLGVTLWSLRDQHRLMSDRPVELHNVDRVAHADGLDQLPADYGAIPAPKAQPLPEAIPILGPPLPGDLGNAMVRHQEAQAVPGLGATRVDPAADAARVARLNREREAEEAAKAPLFFRGSRPQAAQPGSDVPHPASAAERDQTPAAQAAAHERAMTESQSAQDEKERFLSRSADPLTVSLHRIQQAASENMVTAGTVIPAALITGIDSDLPGTVLATVTEPIFDSASGSTLLIPQGSRLIGEYDSQVAFGQRRVLLVWTRLLFPDASSITLDRLPASDTAGHAGLEDGVDRHWRELASGAALSTLIGIAAELASPDRSAGAGQVIVATRQSLQDSVNQTGQELSRRNLNVQPTLTIRPGYPVHVIVQKDLVLRSYRPLFIRRSTP